MRGMKIRFWVVAAGLAVSAVGVPASLAVLDGVAAASDSVTAVVQPNGSRWG